MIVFNDHTRKLTLDITGYQFPKLAADNIYDANWLMVDIGYQDEKSKLAMKEPCLLTDDILDICNEIECVLCGEEPTAILTFIEPYLALCVARAGEDLFTFSVRADIATQQGDNKVWDHVRVAETMTSSRLREVLAQFDALYEKFPAR